MLKKLFTIGLFVFLFTNFWSSSAYAAGDRLIVDPKCIQYKTLYQEPRACNDLCPESCVEAGNYCHYNTTPQLDPVCTGRPLDIFEANDELAGINIFGANFGPPEYALPLIIRLILFGVFSVMGLLSIGYGFYGMYVRSTAQDSAEKVELSNKIYKNAILGVIISFSAVIIMQIIALLLGVSGSLFTFNLVPKQGTNVTLTEDDLSGYCLDGQIGIIEGNAAAGYVCENGAWTTVNTVQ